MGSRSRSIPIDRLVLGRMLLLGGLGVAGLWDPRSGEQSPLGLLAWLTVLSLPAGICASAGQARFWPYGSLVPALWSFELIFSSLMSVNPLPAPMGGMAAVTGLYGLGFAIGCLMRKGVLAPSAIALFSLLLLISSAQRGGLGELEVMPARDQPAIAKALVELSPLVFAYECAGVDWTHANPDVYAQSGVEWFPRNPYNGRLAGTSALLLGALLALLTDRRRISRLSSPKEQH